MKKLSLPFIEHNKLVAIAVISIIILLGVSYYFFSLYQDVMESKTSEYKEMELMVIDNTNLSEVHSIERYHGDQLYYVLDGVTDNNEESFVYVSQNDQDWKFETFNKESLHSEDVLLKEWENRCQNCEYLGSTIGLDNNTPILEIKYLDSSERLVYEHVILEDKSHYRLTLTPSFQ
ncbi:DUF5590 domain-containing protein [Gracilibacillus kekensis]|uniref:Uncharacterized protein YpmB n=1 Tax=Gracilibacillus kekensis TaxID=1027249 RepID=A0A1M7PPY6_9BACI|nr:DUF5590 domain-containing protein [Gracilibacillus kekensis]SHN19229.1 Uncharacterized protein YpmB [Gracilibacillus kekensis]